MYGPKSAPHHRTGAPSDTYKNSSTELCITKKRNMNELPNLDYITKRDRHPEPFQCVVIIGESHVAQGLWVETFAGLLKQFQGDPTPKIVNAGIGGNCISPRSPGYPASQRPSGLERFKTDVIDHAPDLVVISYGLNDMRAGMPVTEFVEDLSYLIEGIQNEIDPIIVLTTIYNMSAYSLYTPFDKGSVEMTEEYNLAIYDLAEKYDALVADIWQAEGGAPWVMDTDTVHANKLGHILIGHCVFQTVVTNCSGAANSLKVDPEERERQLRRRHREALERVEIRVANLQTEQNREGRFDTLW